MWLDADALIHERSKGTKSLDDFARAFFGIHDGSYVTSTYTFDDLVAALNAVLPYGWAAFLHTRLESHGPGAPLDGITRGGYRIVYTDTPSPFTRASEQRRHVVNLELSLGMTVGLEATLSSVLWDSPAFKAGLTVGTKLLSVDGTPYDADTLKQVVTAAKNTEEPIQLTVQSGSRVWTVAVNYYGGLRYPHLQRVEGTRARLDEILAAR